MPRVTKPTTRARRRQDDLSRELAILDAAEAAFIRDGYLGATTDRIASLAGVSVGTVYNIHGSKERLYAAVAERVGKAMTSHVQRSVLPVTNPDAAVEVLVRFRLRDFDRHRLLLVLFSSERVVGACPDPESVPGELRTLYYAYLDNVATVFSRGMDQGFFARMHPVHLALTFEGVLNAFAGYWLRPRQDGRLEQQAREVTDTFLKMAGLKPTPARTDDVEPASRQVFVTSFDMSRLRELIAVARAFGSEGNAAHLGELEEELQGSCVVEPAAVPRDVVTMNSRVRLRCLPSGESRACTLVFPADADQTDGRVSVLTPLGTALLGRRLGAVVESMVAGEPIRCEVSELLYQPEAAGDFHR